MIRRHLFISLPIFCHYLCGWWWITCLRSLRVPSCFHFSEGLGKGQDPLVAGAWRWMGHLVLCLHHCNIKLLVCLAWNDNRSTEIALTLFVLIKNFCPPSTEVTHDKRVTGEVFIPQVTEAFCLLSGRLVFWLASIFLFGHIEWKSFLKMWK